MTGLDPFAEGGIQPEKRVATDAEWAAMPFEPLDPESMSVLRKRLGAEGWKKDAGVTGVNLRLAVALLARSKPQLVESTRELIADVEGQDAVIDFLECLQAEAERLKEWAEILDTAWARQMVAVAAAEEENQP